MSSESITSSHVISPTVVVVTVVVVVVERDAKALVREEIPRAPTRGE